MPPDIVETERSHRDAVPAAIPAQTLVGERRRPGRPAEVSPALVGLLRWRSRETVGAASVPKPRRAMAKGLVVAATGLASWGGALWFMGTVAELNRAANMRPVMVQTSEATLSSVPPSR